MASGELSAADLVAYYIARIDEFDSALNAFITVNKQAPSAADELDKERAGGHVRSALHGIPIVIKDNINTADMPTTGGCLALSKLQPAQDAFVVAQLRKAGAIILGKANLHELACSGESVSSLGGQVRNPYSLEHTPGGSSGGTAVAIAANLAVCGLGSDTINSVRSPASACNIVGLRPTLGRVSRSGLMPVSLNQDVIGPMGRTVEDVAALLEIISESDPNDPMTARSVGHSSVAQPSTSGKNHYGKSLSKDGLSEKRIGIVADLWGHDPVHAGVNQLVSSALSSMESLGAQTVELAVHVDIEQMLSEFSLNLWEGSLHLNQYLESMGESAPVKTLEDLLKTNNVHPSIVPTLEKMASVDTPLGSSEYWQRLYPRRVQLRKLLTHLFQQYQLDALVYPHQKRPVARIGERQQERNGFLAAACGFPAITFPVGFVTEGKSELPVGIELMAQPFEEKKLLQMAYAYEQAVQPRRKPHLNGATAIRDSDTSKTTPKEQTDAQHSTSKGKSSRRPQPRRAKSEKISPDKI